MANITAVPDVALIPTENIAMGFYILIIGELHDHLKFSIINVNDILCGKLLRFSLM